MTDIKRFVVYMFRKKAPENRLAALLSMKYPAGTASGNKVNFAYDYTYGMDSAEMATKAIMFCKEQ